MFFFTTVTSTTQGITMWTTDTRDRAVYHSNVANFDTLVSITVSEQYFERHQMFRNQFEQQHFASF